MLKSQVGLALSEVVFWKNFLWLWDIQIDMEMVVYTIIDLLPDSPGI
jgi:hypothetical protein